MVKESVSNNLRVTDLMTITVREILIKQCGLCGSKADAQKKIRPTERY